MSRHLHTCSHYCDRPDCTKSQRDAMREKLKAPVRLTEMEVLRLIPDGMNATIEQVMDLVRGIESEIFNKLRIE